MSLRVFKNNNQTLSNNSSFGQLLKDEDLNILRQSLGSLNFAKADAEVVVYDENKNLFRAYPNEHVRFTLIDDKPAILAKKLLAEYGIEKGKYSLAANFINPVFGNTADRFLVIQSISASRREIALRKVGFNSPLTQVTRYFQSVDLYPNIYLSLGSNRNFIVTSVRIDPKNSNILFVKLYEPLPQDIFTKQSVYISQFFLEAYIDTINLDITSEGNVPDVSDHTDLISTGDDEFDSSFFEELGIDDLDSFLEDYEQALEDILGSTGSTGVTLSPDFSVLDPENGGGTNIDSSNEELVGNTIELIRALTSGSRDLGLDIQGGFDNFVHFSSAERRVLNFREKIKLIESYKASLATANSLSSGAGSTISYYQAKVDDLELSLDEFERFLYNNSGSSNLYTSQSTKITPWPKSTSTKPYRLFSHTSSLATSWYTDTITYAKTYDRSNKDALQKSIPILQYEDERNSNQVVFSNLIGHFFDTIYNYIVRLQLIQKRDYNYKNALPPEILIKIASNLGINLATSEFKATLANMYASGSSSQSKSSRDLISEVLNRGLNTAGYLSKRRGTKDSFTATLNKYGIPSSFYEFREFGGTLSNSTRVIRNKVTRPYSYLRITSGSQYITTPWKAEDSNVPLTVTFTIDPDLDVRAGGGIRTPVLYSTGSTHTLWTVGIENTSTINKRANLYFEISSSNSISASIPNVYILENYPTTLTIRRNSSATTSSSDDVTYQFIASQQRFGKITVFQSASLTITGSSGATQQALNEAFTSASVLQMGGSTYKGFIYDLKYWNSRLSDDFIKDLTLAQNVAGNYVTNEIVRYPLKYNFNTSQTSSLTSQHRSLVAQTTFDDGDLKKVYFTGFSNSDFVNSTTFLYLQTPNGPQTVNTQNKVRIVSSSLNTTLNSQTKLDVTSEELFGQESKEFEVSLSVGNYVEEAFYNLLGYVNLDDYLGDPRELGEGTYKSLVKLLRDYQGYFNKHNVNNYIRSVEYYDGSLTSDLESQAPGSTICSVGLTFDNRFITNISKEPVNQPSGKNSLLKGITSNSITGSFTITSKENGKTSYTSITGSLNFKIPEQAVGIINKNGYIVDSSLYGIGNCLTNSYGIVQVSIEPFSCNRGAHRGIILATGSRDYDYCTLDTGTRRRNFEGSRLEGPGVNLPSCNVIDGCPVIERVRSTQQGKKLES